MRRWIWLAALLLAVTVGGYLYMNRDFRSDIAGAEPAFELSAEHLYQQYTQDEAAADQQYLGEILLVSGTATSVERQEPITVVLGTGDLGAVVCELNAELLEESNLPEPGDQLAIKATCSGMLLDVILVNGVIVKS